MKNLSTATVFNIQSFSVHDGPGIRTTVFMKGCPLRCKWCHNPEGLSRHRQLQYISAQCIGCKKCEQVCPHQVHTFGEKMHELDWDQCQYCGQCIEACPAQALVQCGRIVTCDELLKILLQDQIFYGKEGGVTFSGGEALMQWPFLCEVLQKCKEKGLHTVIDTSGYCKWEHLAQTLPYCDLYLYDIKSLNVERHQAMTGVDPTVILENLRKLDQENKPLWIRIPVIKGLNASEKEMRAIAHLVKSLEHVEQTTLMPYHVLGKEKYATLGLTYSYDQTEQVTERELEEYKAIFRQEGILLK